MTSDAKIGLLLGLVFIFVIAFIINGLPNLRPQTSRAEITPNSVISFPDQAIGIGGSAQTQVDQEWNTLVDGQEPEVEQAPVVIDPPSPMVETPATQPETVVAHDVRFESPLPSIQEPARDENPLARIRSLLQDITVGQANHGEQTSTVNMNVPTPTTEPATLQTPAARTEVRPAETVARSVEQPRPSAPAFVKPAGKIYLVGEGESLSALAKRAYGPEEGNRIVNVNRIFEANRDLLKSPDEVKAGQKLVVPPLPKTTVVNPNNPSDVLRGELFERVQTLRKPVPTQMPTLPAGTRWYTVQDGDNLWKIASGQLGAGARYEEIAKINADLLKDAKTLDVGMKIRLPVK